MVTLDCKKCSGQLYCSSDDLQLIREHFSMQNPAYKRGSRFAQSRLYSITPSGKFEIGLTKDIIIFLDKNYIKYSLTDQLDKEFNCGFDFDNEIETLNISYRDYQKISIEESVKQGRGINIIPTAGGKTLICAGLIKNLRTSMNKPNAIVFVIVPSIQLVEQTASDFLSYGLTSVTKWSGNNKIDINCNIIIAGMQFLLSKKTDLSILSDVDILLVDECHGLRRGNEINKVLKFVNTPHKFGFTGTLPPAKIDQWNIIGKIGPIIYEKKTDSLKQENYISNFKITILNIHHKKYIKTSITNNPIDAYKNEIDFLINSNFRNNIIAKLSLMLKNNTLIMVDRITHGELIENAIKNLETDKKIFFIRGSTDIEDREEIRSFMMNRDDVVIIAISKIFSTGINIPNLHNIIFASTGKSKIKIMQSIGRVLRLHHTKTMANIFDISDNTKYSKLHLEERKKLYILEKYENTQKEIKEN